MVPVRRYAVGMVLINLINADEVLVSHDSRFYLRPHSLNLFHVVSESHRVAQYVSTRKVSRTNQVKLRDHKLQNFDFINQAEISNAIQSHPFQRHVLR
jgi:hypothetical protein